MAFGTAAGAVHVRVQDDRSDGSGRRRQRQQQRRRHRMEIVAATKGGDGRVDGRRGRGRGR